MRTETKRIAFYLDRESPGFFLWTEQNGHPLPKSSQLLFKQNLFRSDEQSFYGTVYPLTEAQDRNETILTGTVIPLGDAVSLRNHFPEILTAEQMKPKPTQFGGWSVEHLPDLPVFSSDKGLFDSDLATVLFAGYGTHGLNQLQSDPDERIRKWAVSLTRPEKTCELPLHLYHYCLSRLGLTENKPFQVALAVHEPDLISDEWKVELAITETKTKRTAVLNDIRDGRHSFIQNPMPYISEKVQALSRVPGLEMFAGGAGVIEMEDEAVYALLQSYQGLCESAGVAVLVPQSWEQTADLRVNGEIRPGSSGTGAEVDWFFTHHDSSLPEDTIRKWVDEERYFIKFDRRWMRWDLQKAKRYLAEIDRIRGHHRASLFQAIQEIAYMPGDESYTELTNDDSRVAFSLSPDWFEAVRKTSAPSLGARWASILKPYQDEGARWLLAMRNLGLGACLADDMGLGKTVQAIAYCEHVTANGTGRILIVCPTSLLENWVQEFERFAPDVTVSSYYGSPDQRSRLDFSDTQVVLTTYPLLIRDSERLSAPDWAAVLMDEAQMIKNSRTQIWKEAKKLRTPHRIAITGTPVENRLSDLWSLFDWFAEGYLGPLPSFLSRFSGETENRLAEVIEPFVLRRTKDRQRPDWHLPEKTEKTIYSELTREQHLLYRAVVEETADTLEYLAPHERKGVFFKGLTRLKQICNHPAHYYDERTPLGGRSGKWEQFMETSRHLLETGRQAIVFTQYRKMGYLLQDGLKENFGLDAAFLNGALKMKERYRMVEEFNRGDSAPFLIVSIRAGGTGLNMTGASEVIHYDRWWNPAVDRQAADRVHRIGQTKPVTVHALTTKGTVEESIEKALLQKEALYGSLFQTGKQTPVWRLPAEKIRSLFYGA
ncbi:DEAD/DEAH box helicase [Alteribacter natronophilus]|uniref:DEAD/DEAH box helicase n=1 Tax=Alteribacter natronophilus TaxID=2583810 RepID=UPI00110EE074|nr:DEAD/DEAH box helicase [Alteribacter natronophilus]TMW71497.1 DEAD/DEAH box helicase [Alteribacter natronophilus]